MDSLVLGSELLDGIVERAGRPDYPAFEAQLRSSGYCARPVRLRGSVETCDKDGQRRVWSTKDEPDGILRKACGNRREAVCGPCAERYRGDAYQLIAAGLRGGKGVPESVSGHPAVFVTLTAPSFGPVHSRLLGPDGKLRPCRARRDRPVCPHGMPLSCGLVHGERDACLGEPLCRECFDYRGAVVWNNTLGQLWRYTTIGLPRTMARLCEITQKQLKHDVRPACAKVTEFQHRGLVHVHALIRLDRAMPDYRADQLRPPAKRYDAELLEHALRETVADVDAPIAEELGEGRVRWGRQLDVRQLNTGQQRAEIAGYLAKYATKSTEQAGGLLHRIDADTVDRVPVREHVRDFMRAAFDLDAEITEQRAATPPAKIAVPTLGVEDDWHPAALGRRVREAISRNEPVRVTLRNRQTHTGTLTRLTADAPPRQSSTPPPADPPEPKLPLEDHPRATAPGDATTLALELDGRLSIHLADITLIVSAARPPRARKRSDPRLAACAHAFGYRGHCLTKGRRYSTTFKQLRADREAWVHQQILARSRDATQRALADATERVVLLEIDGIGHVTAADAHLAASAAARARERRRIGREEHCDLPPRAIKARRRATAQTPMQEHEPDRSR